MFFEIEFGYRPRGGREYRIADLAMAPLSAMRGDYFDGAPELIVEVLSPSNTARELAEKARVSIKNGTREFWVLDSKRRQVKVSASGGVLAAYGMGQTIPLFFAPGKLIAVDDIFTESASVP